MADNPFDDDSAEAMRRFARPVRDGVGEPDPLLCRHLRARGPVSHSQAAGGAARVPSPSYWCLRTMRPPGPDGALALPEDCTDERICFEPAVAREVES
ncbi:MAG: hypothetical protein ABR576_15145 [Thermoanaerobaculia bacterium]